MTERDRAGGSNGLRIRLLDAWHRNRPLRELALLRLVWVLPTLFGISLVTFAVLNLAEAEVGAPAAGSGLRSSALTEEAAESLRRTYGFDLPLFFNFNIQDRGRRVRQALKDLGVPSRSARAHARLVGSTTLVFPEAVDALAAAVRSGARANVARLASVLDQVLERIREPERETLRSGPAEGYLEWWKRSSGSFRAPAIRAAVLRLENGDKDARGRVLRIHKRAVPRLVERLLDPDTGPSARRRLSLALSEITGHVVIYDPKAPAAERRSVLGQWKDFFRAEETVYRDLSGVERFTGAFTRTRYARWLSMMLKGDFGESLYYRRRAWDVIAAHLPVTLGLSLAAFLLAYLLSVPLGVWSAVRRGTWRDRTVTSFLFVLYSLPSFWVALMLIILLGGIEGPNWFPTSGLRSFDPADYPAGSAFLDLLWHGVLPVFCLSYAMLAVVSRYQRSGMIQVLGQDYIRTARAKGLSERAVVWKHGLRNGIIPMINLLGLQLPYLFGGSVIVETIFDIPGMGLLTYTAIHQRDTNVLMGIVSVTAVLTLFGMVLSDLLMLWADPRISFRKGAVS